MNFGEAHDVQPPQAPGPEEQTTREWILEKIPAEPGSPRIAHTQDIACFCMINQQMDYLEGPQDIMQTGLEINFEHWEEIIEKLGRDQPVETEEALGVASAIDNILSYAPEAFWRRTREENRKSLHALEAARNGSRCIEGETKKTCMQGLPHMRHDLASQKEIFENAHQELARGEKPSFESRIRRKLKRLSQEALEKAIAGRQRTKEPEGHRD